jgi:hypothetical protein
LRRRDVLDRRNALRIITFISTTNSGGPTNGPIRSEPSVRRSRAVSTMLQAISAGDFATPRDGRRRSRPRRISSSVRPGKRCARLAWATGQRHAARRRRDHEVVDERLDLLHHVARGAHAAALRAELAEPLAQMPRRHRRDRWSARRAARAEGRGRARERPSCARLASSPSPCGWRPRLAGHDQLMARSAIFGSDKPYSARSTRCSRAR